MAEIIEVEGVSKTFGRIGAVKNVSFVVQAGEIFAFLGPNGAGKSTTIKMLTTLLEPSSGQILLDGKDVWLKSGEVRRLFGIVFQDPSLDDKLTAYENLKFHGVLYGLPKKTLKDRIAELLNFVELWDRRNDLVEDFSGGMKRRLEIARGLLHHPKILFLDEPTIGLDPQTRHHIWDYITKLNKSEGITIFFTTHYMEEAEAIAQKVAVIDHGEIVAQGTPESLKKETGAGSLEDAFLILTGKNIREEESNGSDKMKTGLRMMGRK
ncbi:MAG TPA: ATP-binding cassette domain-containing protein [Candidatus Tyrphobacter sp.]|nr:ATP-binding cassette domain-containing protein [Candidatus Tyrphobacter sp.]